MLGSAADAEDVVQDSWLRWADVDHDAVATRGPTWSDRYPAGAQPAAHAERQREAYVGPWLPEPLVTGPDVLEDVELADSVSFAMLVVLETLTPWSGRCSCCGRSSASGTTRSLLPSIGRRRRCASSPLGPAPRPGAPAPGEPSAGDGRLWPASSRRPPAASLQPAR